jgi:hypothetical protein
MFLLTVAVGLIIAIPICYLLAKTELWTLFKIACTFQNRPIPKHEDPVLHEPARTVIQPPPVAPLEPVAKKFFTTSA